jgi:hypothetical protein
VAQARLEQGEQLGVAVGAHGDRLDHRAAELGGELVDVDLQPFGAGDVGHVEGDHERPAELRELEDQAQVHAQVGRVDDGDDRVGRRLAVAPALDHLERDLLVGRRRRQAVRAGQVDDRDRAAVLQPRQADLALDRHAGVVGDLLARAGEQVEEGGLAAVRVADQRHAPARRLVRGVQRVGHDAPTLPSVALARGSAGWPRPAPGGIAA